MAAIHADEYVSVGSVQTRCFNLDQRIIVVLPVCCCLIEAVGSADQVAGCGAVPPPDAQGCEREVANNKSRVDVDTLAWQISSLFLIHT